MDDATAQGGRVVIGGSAPPDMPGPYEKGYFFQPTVIADATPSMKIYREETFGPAMPLFKFKYDEEAVKMANDTEYGLAAYFFTKVHPEMGLHVKSHHLCLAAVCHLTRLAQCAQPPTVLSSAARACVSQAGGSSRVSCLSLACLSVWPWHAFLRGVHHAHAIVVRVMHGQHEPLCMHH